MRITITRGLDIALEGAPEQQLYDGSAVRHVAVKGADYRGIKPSLKVAVDDRVRLGDVLFTDRFDPRLSVTAPGAGIVVAINRGPRRSLTSVVIQLDGDAAVEFTRHTSGQINTLTADQVQQQLLQAGLWAALRTRPFNRIASPATRPHWLFVTAMDSNPGALDPQVAVAEHKDELADGLRVLARLGAETIFLCHGPEWTITAPEALSTIKHVQFDGPHPAGLPGTHIQYLAHADLGQEAWHINFQDVVAVGRLFRHGELWTERNIALSGGGVRQPRLLRTRLGAKLSELLQGETHAYEQVISGPVLSGQTVTETTDYLGRYHQQLCVLPKPKPQQAWRSKLRQLATDLQRSPAAIFGAPAATSHRAGLLPVEAFERVWPFTNAPVPLLRALLARDAETAETLGCLSFAEEDMALLAAVCPAKQDYGAALRQTLDTLEQD